LDSARHRGRHFQQPLAAGAVPVGDDRRLAAVLYTFITKVAELLMQLRIATQDEVIIGVLKLVDLSLIANLIVIVICSSYENFVAPKTRGRTPTGREDLSASAFRTQAETARLDRGDSSGQRARLVHGYRSERDNLKLTWVVESDRLRDRHAVLRRPTA